MPEIQITVIREDENGLPTAKDFGGGKRGANMARELNKRLEDGDAWAWCSVTVRAAFGELTEETYLGACSYKDEADFIKSSSYYDDMRQEVEEKLEQRLRTVAKEIGEYFARKD